MLRSARAALSWLAVIMKRRSPLRWASNISIPHELVFQASNQMQNISDVRSSRGADRGIRRRQRVFPAPTRKHYTPFLKVLAHCTLHDDRCFAHLFCCSTLNVVIRREIAGTLSGKERRDRDRRV